MKIIGRVTRYTGTEHRYLLGVDVRIVGVICDGKILATDSALPSATHRSWISASAFATADCSVCFA